jgi:hypothetical protein
MKLSHVLLSAATLALVGGATNAVVNADTAYPDATHANVTGSISFGEDNDPTLPTDPEDPDKPINPVDPTNPNGAELMITYASNLKFGEQSKNATEFHALADKIIENGTEKELVPIVSVKDSRGTDRKGWVLTAKLDKEFVDSKGNPLKGADLSFSNMKFADREDAPTAGENVTLSNEAQEIASTDANHGIGVWSMALGQLSGEAGSQTTDGVTLTVPTTSSKNTDGYSTTVTYELTADPSAAN